MHPQTVTAAKAAGEVEIHLTTRKEENCQLTLDIADASGRSVFTHRQRVRIDDKPVAVPFAVERPQLWSPSEPTLYAVTVTLSEPNGNICDRVSVRTGFRAIDVTPKGGLSINGQQVKVRGVTLYHDSALSGGTPSANDIDADLRQLEDLGANALRSAVMPHAQYLYDRCDEKGLLVWIDVPLHRAFLSDVAIARRRSSKKTVGSSCAKSWRSTSIILRWRCGAYFRGCGCAATIRCVICAN